MLYSCPLRSFPSPITLKFTCARIRGLVRAGPDRDYGGSHGNGGAWHEAGALPVGFVRPANVSAGLDCWVKLTGNSCSSLHPKLAEKCRSQFQAEIDFLQHLIDQSCYLLISHYMVFFCGKDFDGGRVPIDICSHNISRDDQCGPFRLGQMLVTEHSIRSIY